MRITLSRDGITPSLRILVWVLSLAALAVGARNFEWGLNLDAPLYASIAREIARSGEWFRLDPLIPDFQPFTEHPHLGFWLVAVAFKVLPADDWSARLVGHGFYVASLLLLFHWIRRRNGEGAATLAIVCLWIWYRFSNTFSSVYLDPGVLFFGMFALYAFERSVSHPIPTRLVLWALVSGVSVALAALYKGLTVLGFFPGFLVLSIESLEEAPASRYASSSRRIALALAVMLGVAVVVLTGYLQELRTSRVPDFLSRYWHRHMTNRFNSVRSLANVWDSLYWRTLRNETYYLAFLAPLGLRRVRDYRRYLLPVVLLLTFAVMFSTVRLTGGQYLIMVLPWVAWLLGEAGGEYVERWVRPIQRASLAIALTLLVALQYLPFPTHAVPPTDRSELKRLGKAWKLNRLHLWHLPRAEGAFVAHASYAWYSGLRVNVIDAPIKASAEEVLVIERGVVVPTRVLEKQGWCFHQATEVSSIWLECAALRRDADDRGTRL